MKKILTTITEEIRKIRSKNKAAVNNIGKLYPKTLNTAEMELYIDQLEQITVDKKIKNVAVTGPYGIGKSSVLETYFQSDRLKKETIFVNLPDFWQVKTSNIEQNEKVNDDKKDDCEQSNKQKETGAAVEADEGAEIRNNSKINNKTVDESILQRKILEQIIFGTGENIPFMTMRKSEPVSKHKVLFFVMLSVLSAPAIANFFSQWDWSYSEFTALSSGEMLASLVIIFFVSCLLWKVVNLFKISKISVKAFGQGIAVEEKEELPFNKYAEDLIKFFNYSRKKYIVIEDLDRYEYTGIYKELRDLNQLINRSLKGEKRVVFIYALRDTLIVEDKEKNSVDTKAKFFDYVIPILSNTSFNNGFETLKSELEEIKVNYNDKLIGLDSLFEEKDLRLLGYYLNGHRVIKLITAETKQLLERILSPLSENDTSIKSKLEYIGISAKEVLGSVIYKNYYPHEYEKSTYHEADIDLFNTSLQLTISKMNTKITDIKSKIIELEDTIKEYQEVEDLTSEELKKEIFIDFLKTFDEKEIYLKTNNGWITLDLDEIDSAYEKVANNLDEYNPENIVFYRKPYSGNSNKIKTILKSDLEKGKYKLSYKTFENVDIIGDQIIEWKRQKKKYEQRKEFLGKQNDFSVIYSFLKEQNCEREYSNIEDSRLKNVIKKIGNDKLRDMLFLNGFVTLNFNNIISSFPNSKLDGNDREIIESATVGNTIELNQTVNNPEEVIKELNRIEISYSNIENYSIAECLFEDESKKYQNEISLILQNWKDKRIADVCYRAFDKENYSFLNHILSEWPNGLLNEENEIMNLNSFFLMLIDKRIEIELAKQPYMRALDTKEAGKMLNQFITNNEYLGKQVLDRIDGKVKFSYLSFFDKSTLQMMFNYNLFDIKTEIIEQLVKANTDDVFNFGSLATFLTEFKDTRWVSKILNEDELFFLIENINEKAEELLSDEKSLEDFLLLIDLLKENIDDPKLLILKLLVQAKLEEVELSLTEKQKLTEEIGIDDLVYELDDENYEMVSLFSEVVEKSILKYSEKFVAWFEVVSIDTKRIILNDIFNQNTVAEEVINDFITEKTIVEVPEFVDINKPAELNYILLKNYLKEYTLDEKISEKIVKQISEYILDNNLQDRQILEELIKKNLITVEEKANFIYKLINVWDYTIIDIANSLSIESKVKSIVQKSKNAISNEAYSNDIFALLKALEKLNLTHSLQKKNDGIHYRLKKDVENYM